MFPGRLCSKPCQHILGIGLFHFLSVQGDGRKIPGLVRSMNFQRSTAKSPKIPGGCQHFATKFIEIEIFTLSDFSRQSCRCKQEFQGKKGKIFSRGARLEHCTFTKSSRHSRTLVVHLLIFFRWVFRGENMPGKFFQALLFRRQKIPPYLLEKPYINWHFLRTKLAKMLGNS